MNVEHGQSPTIYEAKGCNECTNTGYRGRTGLYELIAVDGKLSQMIHDDASEAEMEHYARFSHPSMRQDGFQRILKGDTTLEEVVRVTSED